MQIKSDSVVLVAGAGVFGVSVANHLVRENPAANLTVKLINPTDYAYFLPSAVRLTVSKDYSSSIIPLEKVLDKEVEFIKDKVASFTKTHVTLQSEAVLPFDVLILATGSRWPDPVSSTSTIGDDYKSHLSAQRHKIKEGKHIVFIGGGFVNSEIAGELAYKYADEIKSGKKKISIIHSSDRLLPDDGKYGNSLRDKVTKHLKNNGVGLYLNSKASISPENKNRIILQGGKVDSLDADVIFEGTGIRPNIPTNDLPQFCDERGFVRVNKTFQAVAVKEGCIFAIGDVTDFLYHGLLKRDNWVKVITRNVVEYLRGTPATQFTSASTYGPGPIPNVVSLGPKAGEGQLPLPFFGAVTLPSFLAVQAKSKDLFSGKKESMYSK